MVSLGSHHKITLSAHKEQDHIYLVMISNCVKRLMKDYNRLKKEGETEILADPSPDDWMHWTATMVGPKDTIWQQGTFTLNLNFTEDYPNAPPEVIFTSKMFHPNIYVTGGICLDMLKTQWNPSYDVFAVLTTIRALLGEPNPKSPVNHVAGQLFSTNLKEYNRRVTEIVQLTWEG